MTPNQIAFTAVLSFILGTTIGFGLGTEAERSDTTAYVADGLADSGFCKLGDILTEMKRSCEVRGKAWDTRP